MLNADAMKNILIGVIAVVLAGCQPSDEEIRADIASKARKDFSFTGLDYTVQNGVVNFTGRCPSQKALATVKQNVKNIHVIRSVNYNVVVAPVVLDSLTLIKLQADSLLVNYPQVIANVKPDGITLKGFVTAAKRVNLIKDARLNLPGNVKDSLNVSRW